MPSMQKREERIRTIFRVFRALCTQGHALVTSRQAKERADYAKLEPDVPPLVLSLEPNGLVAEAKRILKPNDGIKMRETHIEALRA